MPPKFLETEKEARLTAFNKLCPKGPSYDDKGCAICPKCNEGFELGAVGMAVLYLNHMDTKICEKAQKRAKGASTPGMKSIFSYWGAPKPKAATVASTTASPALIATQAIAKNTVSLPEDNQTPSVTPPTDDTAYPTRSLDPDGGLTYTSALQILQYLLTRLDAPVQANDFLGIFDQAPEAFDPDPAVSVDDIWEGSLNSDLHAAFGPWSDELKESDVAGVTAERVAGFVEFMEYFVRRGLDAVLFKERARRLVKGLEKWRTVRGGSCSGQSSVRNSRRAASVEIVEIPDVDDCCSGRKTPPLHIPANSTENPAIEALDKDQRDKHPPPAITPAVRSSARSTSCIGHVFNAPNGVSPHASYPFALHDKLSLPWDYTVRNGRMILHSRNCTETVSEPGAACLPCRNLSRNNILSGIVERMRTGIREGTGWAYYGMGGIHELLRLKSRQIEHYRLRHLNYVRKLARKAAALDEHKLFLTAIASKRVERVDRIIRLGLKQGRGIKGLLRQYLNAAKGLYKPKSFEEEDYLKGLVLWKLGGNRIASIAHRALGLPSITTLRNQVRIPPIALSAGRPTTVEIAKNVESTFNDLEDALKLSPGTRKHHAVLMFDEIATEKRLRWDPKTNQLVGLCREHAHKVPREFVTEDDMKEVFRGLDDGSVHQAGEATIAALGLLSDDSCLYAARGVMISGDCKKETGVQHAKVIETALDGVNSQKEKTNVRVVSLASDGESRRGSALALLTFKKKLSPDSDIYSQVSALPFMDHHVGDDDITADKDYKHVFKRLRNLLLREKGIVVGGDATAIVAPLKIRFLVSKYTVTNPNSV